MTVERIKDGQKRSARVIYSKGMEGDYGEGYHGDWQTFGITFSMGEAFWNGPETTVGWSLISTDKPLISNSVKFLPIVIGKSHVQGTYKVNIEGDAPAYPVWTIIGPATDIRITNKITGQKIQINGEVKIGETITIDTRNYTLAGTSRNENDLWDALSLDSTLFPLSTGANEIETVATGLSADSEITATYRQQFLKGY
ncbi:phage distal tail protein [uncultured Rothia sp.]|uniref:phage distal tail protein n=1 Tax=uncultured Rothia sp. TaxID=316088 RepID=UPI003217F7CE